MLGVLTREGKQCEDIDTQRECQVIKEAETGVIPTRQRLLALPKQAEARKNSPKGGEGAWS